MGISIRDKGQRAERAVVDLLNPIIARVCAADVKLSRNLSQTQKGGHDLVGLDWLAIEVKHQETLCLDQWWAQAKRQAEAHSLTTGKPAIPVLIWKQNRVKFKVRMPGQLVAGNLRVNTTVDIALPAFLLWFETMLKTEMQKTVATLNQAAHN